MRIDPDICTDPALLAAEVRRLQAVIAASDTLTDAERLLIQSAAEGWEEHAQLWRDNDERVADEADSNAATLRGLLERTR
jgi:hypothetical protein